MNLTKRFAALVVGSLLLAPAAALADRDSHDRYPDRRGRNGGGAYRPAPPVIQPRGGGRYELRPVQRWVEGRNEQVWIPEQCVSRHHGHRVKCYPGYYENRWVPGYNQTVEEWVWVPRVYGPRGGVRVSFNF